MIEIDVSGDKRWYAMKFNIWFVHICYEFDQAISTNKLVATTQLCIYGSFESRFSFECIICSGGHNLNALSLRNDHDWQRCFNFVSLCILFLFDTKFTNIESNSIFLGIWFSIFDEFLFVCLYDPETVTIIRNVCSRLYQNILLCGDSCHMRSIAFEHKIIMRLSSMKASATCEPQPNLWLLMSLSWIFFWKKGH